MSDLIQPYDEDLAALLSAYLDGQLSSDEANRVEQRLAEEPELRGLLEQLRQVSQMVRDLPVSAVPAELADEVMQQLERDALLGMSEAPSEIAGRTHLRFRRFAAAAAILVLAGAVVTIVYSVLFKPPAPPPENQSEEVVVSGFPEVDTTEMAPEPETHIAKSIVSPVYSQVHLVLNSLEPASEADRLDRLINRLDIEHPITQTSNNNETIYFFFTCSVEQLHEIFTDLKQADTVHRIDALIRDKNQDSVAAIYHVSESQLLALSRETDSTVRYELAMNYHQSDVATLWQFPWESYLPNLYILGPTNEGSPPQPEPEADQARLVGNDAMALVGVQITIRTEEELFPVTIDSAGTDPNSLDTPIYHMPEPKSEIVPPEPNALHHTPYAAR